MRPLSIARWRYAALDCIANDTQCLTRLSSVWPQVIAWAQSTQLAPLLKTRLQSHSVVIPDNDWKQLRQSYWHSVARSAFFERTLNILLQKIEDEIPKARIVLLKSSFTGQTLYQQPAHRCGFDIDILVPKKLQAAIQTLLERQGFTRLSNSRRNYTQQHLYEQQYLKMNGFPALIELHTGLGHSYRYQIDYSALWQRVQPLKRYHLLPKGPARALAPEDNLLYNCLHRANHFHKEPHLLGLLDFHLMICQWTLSWPTLIKRAQSWGILSSLYLSLLSSQHLFHTALPKNIYDMLPISSYQKLWLQSIFPQSASRLCASNPLAFVKKLLYGWALADTWNNRFHFAAHYSHSRIRDYFG